VIGNEDEGTAFAAKMGWDVSDLKGAAAALSKLPKLGKARPRTVVFTHGKEPTIVAVDGVVTTYPVVLLDKSLIVDTNGAGDAFVGGFLAGLAADKPLEKCISAGQYCASRVIQVEGAQYPQEASPFTW